MLIGTVADGERPHCMVYHGPPLYAGVSHRSATQAMSVFAELRIPADGIELGRILGVEGITSIELETLV